MTEALLAIIMISAIFMSGVRRIKMLKYGFMAQSLAIALVCVYFGYRTGHASYYILSLVTVAAKVIGIPVIIDKAAKGLRVKRETDMLLNGIYSYIFTAIAIVAVYAGLNGFHNSSFKEGIVFFKAGIVISIIGAMLMMGRKRALTQMIGFLTMENGLVLAEISLIEISLIVDVSIIFEVLVLAGIMGIMVIHINKTFQTTDTDYLSNLKE
jgi:hydrogenase-4 component E